MSCDRDDKKPRRKCPLESGSDTGAVRRLNSSNVGDRFVNISYIFRICSVPTQ